MICFEDFAADCSGCCLTMFQVFFPSTKREKGKNLFRFLGFSGKVLDFQFPKPRVMWTDY